MSILIKGMAMPKSCLLCPFGDAFGKCCVNAELEDANELTHSCPLVELPDHGELIDRDALNTIKGKTLLEAVYYAPVVIPAERSEASLCDNCDEKNDVGCCWCKKMERSEE